MQQIVDDATLSAEAKSAAMEAYILEAGLAAGVVSEVRVRPPLNPNRWGKHLAPWFDGECKEAKKAFKHACWEFGRGAMEAREAQREYLR